LGSIDVMLMVLLMGEAGRAVVIGRLETMEGKRTGPVGGEENAGKPSAGIKGGGGGKVREGVPITRSIN
jgi:hypothetical protein